MKKNRTELINALLFEWQNSDIQYSDNFRFDGIIDEEKYQNASPKVLFICKEPNSKNHNERFVGDFCKEWREEGAQYPFAYRIAEWSYGIQNKFPPLDELFNLKSWETPYRNALSSIAFMNLKKSPGRGKSLYSEMSNSLKREKRFILEQINLIAPEVIILGLSWKALRDDLIDIPAGDWKQSGYQISICRWNNMKIIDFYHPSSRTPPAASYSLLQNIMNSEVFKFL